MKTSIRLLAFGIFIFASTYTLLACGKASDKTADPAPAASSDFMLSGSVTSAFAVTVDGNQYSDMEAYYTYEVGQLSAQAAAAGYPGYKAVFQAQIGYSDLSNGMTVYIQPLANRGYAAQGSVDSTSNFQVNMPGAAAGDTYQVKATKRIDLLLTNTSDSTDTKKFCWNFNAQNLSVPYSAKDKPIVLNSFVSSITAYECAATSNQGLIVPQNASGTTAETIPQQMSDLKAPPATDDLIYVGTSPNPLVRSHNRSQINELLAQDVAYSVIQSGGAADNLTLSVFGGTPYIQVSAKAHGLNVGDQVYIQGTLSGYGFAATDLNRIFVVELTPNYDTFVIRAARNATLTGQMKPSSTQTENAIKLTSAIETQVWATTNGQSSETTESGQAYTIDTTGKVCWNNGNTCQ